RGVRNGSRRRGVRNRSRCPLALDAVAPSPFRGALVALAVQGGGGGLDIAQPQFAQHAPNGLLRPAIELFVGDDQWPVAGPREPFAPRPIVGLEPGDKMVDAGEPVPRAQWRSNVVGV